MWQSCMSNSISIKHKPLTNVRSAQWILHWPIHSTQISIVVYTISFLVKFFLPFVMMLASLPSRFLLLVIPDLPCFCIDSITWKCMKVSSTVLKQHTWQSMKQSPTTATCIFSWFETVYLIMYVVTPNNILQHEMLIWNSAPEPSSTTVWNI